MLTHHYRYDPLNRLTYLANIQRFYNDLRMTTEIQGAERYSVFQSGDTVLAQTRDEGGSSERLRSNKQSYSWPIIDAPAESQAHVG